MFVEEPTFAGQGKTIRISCPLVDTVLQAIGWHSPKTPVRSSWLPLDLGRGVVGFCPIAANILSLLPPVKGMGPLCLNES